MIKKCINYGVPEPLFKQISGNLVVTLRGKITKEYLEGLDLNKRQAMARESIKKSSILSFGEIWRYKGRKKKNFIN